MRDFVAYLILLLTEVLFAKQSVLHSFFLNLSELEFERARQMAKLEPNSVLRAEMYQLTDILYYEGQTDRTRFVINQDSSSIGDIKATLSVIRELEAGYVNLFYDQLKRNAFSHFHKAYELADEIGDPDLLKFSLLTLLKYYS